jgi:hypothetical protein
MKTSLIENIFLTIAALGVLFVWGAFFIVAVR